MKFNITVFTIVMFLLGALAYLINNYEFDVIVTILYSLGFVLLGSMFILYPIYNYLFGLLGVRHYVIKKGKHRSNLFYFKPMLFGGNYYINPKIHTTFDELNLSFTELTQVNKLFGINYGLPKLNIKTFSLTHKNSIRLGYILYNNKVNYVIYIRKGETIFTKHLKDDINYIVLNTREMSIDIFYSDTTHEYFEFDKLIEPRNYGYYLSKPYFGGKATAPKDIHFDYIVKKH